MYERADSGLYFIDGNSTTRSSSQVGDVRDCGTGAHTLACLESGSCGHTVLYATLVAWKL